MAVCTQASSTEPLEFLNRAFRGAGGGYPPDKEGTGRPVPDSFGGKEYRMGTFILVLVIAVVVVAVGRSASGDRFGRPKRRRGRKGSWWTGSGGGGGCGGSGSSCGSSCGGGCGGGGD
ncbi:hypothetical protein GCM10010406_31220 [Streptomyces thermolineatus]|uniref:Uncharacterized protein n=2 Tax=Streptomyces TaxID=1883 RepID=A0ABP5Z5V7_9ACTN